MKKANLTASALLTAVATSSFAAGPLDGSVYGKVNISVAKSDSGSDQYEVQSNASRFGLKGKTEIADGLYAIYKAEFEMCVDDGDCKGQTISQRNIIGGIQGRYGTLWAGKHDTPTKLALGKVDLFNDLAGDIKNTFEGENRQSNVVAYVTPDMKGLVATVAIVPGEGKDLDGDGRNDDGIADGVSASLTYQRDDLYLAAAMDNDIDRQDLVRLVAKYKVSNLTLGAMYQQNEDSLDSDLKDESGYLISAAYKVDNITLKAQYGEIEDDADGDEEDTLSLGADYKLSGNTKLFAFYTKDTDTDGDTGQEEDSKSIGVGLEHKF
jgi:predicted porin